MGGEKIGNDKPGSEPSFSHTGPTRQEKYDIQSVATLLPQLLPFRAAFSKTQSKESPSFTPLVLPFHSFLNNEHIFLFQ